VKFTQKLCSNQVKNNVPSGENLFQALSGLQKFKTFFSRLVGTQS
jgi:hypothetical protein